MEQLNGDDRKDELEEEVDYEDVADVFQGTNYTIKHSLRKTGKPTLAFWTKLLESKLDLSMKLRYASVVINLQSFRRLQYETFLYPN